LDFACLSHLPPRSPRVTLSLHDALPTSLRGRAYHVARSMVGSSDDALDLSQEAFLKVFRARETFREGDPFLPWFHRILRNTCFRDRKSTRLNSSHVKISYAVFC